jgi:fucose permease
MSVSETTILTKSFIVKNRRQMVQTAAYYIVFVGIGLIVASVGPTLAGLAKNTGSHLSQMGILFTVRAVGALLAALLGSRLYDYFPGNPVMVVMLLVLVLMMSLIPLMPFLWLLALLSFILGFAEIIVDIGGNTLLVWVHRDKVAPFMNGLHFFFGVGAFLSPLIIARVVLWSGDITWAYWTLALLLLPAAIWLMFIPSPARQIATEDEPTRRVDYVMVGLVALFFFLYVGAEIGFGGWIFSYAVTLNLADETLAAYLTSGFYGTFTLGRLLSIPLVARFRPRLVLVTDLVGCLLSLGLIVLWPASLIAVWIGALGLGLSMASIFPTIYSMAGRRMTITGQITGLFFVGASLGGMSIPWLIGQLFAWMQPQAMMVFLLVNLILALGVIMAFISYSKRTSSI